jgi:isoleucyl-tRNA synthetase
MTEDKIAAYMTLYTALVTISKVGATMIPFMADEIYQNLVRSVDPAAPISVHLCSFPEADKTMIDRELEENMKAVVDIVVLGRSARNGAAMKNRQPLAAMYVKCETALDSFYSDIIRDELNVKEVKFIDDMSAISSYSFKPNLKTVGPKYGKLLGQIRAALQNPEFDGNAAMNELKSTGALHFTFGADEVALEEADLLIEVQQKAGYYSIADHGIAVALDTTLTDDLIREGFVREVISKVQTMRKEADFVVTDHIKVSVCGSETVCEILRADSAEFASAVLCDELTFEAFEGALTKEWDVNGEKITVTVAKI